MHRKRILFPQGICFSCRKACQLPWQMRRLLVFIHGTNGFTIADQSGTGAGDASDCVDDVSRVPQHSGKDRCLLPEQLAAGGPPIVRISGGPVMWRRNGSWAFCVPVFLASKSLVSLVYTRCSSPLGLSLLRTLKKCDTASHCALVGPRCSVPSVANSQLHQLCANPMAFLM